MAIGLPQHRRQTLEMADVKSVAVLSRNATRLDGKDGRIRFAPPEDRSGIDGTVCRFAESGAPTLRRRRWCRGRRSRISLSAVAMIVEWQVAGCRQALRRRGCGGGIPMPNRPVSDASYGHSSMDRAKSMMVLPRRLWYSTCPPTVDTQQGCRAQSVAPPFRGLFPAAKFCKWRGGFVPDCASTGVVVLLAG